MTSSRIRVAWVGMASRDIRRFRQAGDGPRSANEMAPKTFPSSPANCTCSSTGSNRPAAASTNSGLVASFGGSRYHDDSSRAERCGPTW
ncbi:Uncharacterised protein [Mycobacteroides abscessus subsp. abscessus]|nr:Uncharacterised protein [Mycobacteroides abscessus subsp. abscessus]